MDSLDRSPQSSRSMLAPLLVFAAIVVVLAYVEAIHGFLALIAFSGLAAILAPISTSPSSGGAWASCSP